MADDPKLKEKLAKLVTVLRELQAKTFEVTEEIELLLLGGAGIGLTLKRLEARFDELWSIRYAPGQTGQYVWAFARDRRKMKELLKTLTVDVIEQRMVSYLRNDDPFYMKARHSFLLFAASINSHADLTLSPVSDEVVRDCHHQPPCSSDQLHTKRRGEEMRGLL